MPRAEENQAPTAPDPVTTRGETHEPRDLEPAAAGRTHQGAGPAPALTLVVGGAGERIEGQAQVLLDRLERLAEGLKESLREHPALGQDPTYPAALAALAAAGIAVARVIEEPRRMEEPEAREFALEAVEEALMAVAAAVFEQFARLVSSRPEK